MKLLSCSVENFGVLHHVKLDFTDGVNVLREDNGWGKSTLGVFIKAMLYGLPVSKKKNLEENERLHYTPWQGDSGAFGGSIVFSARGKTYRLERFFGAKASKDTFALYDLADNRLSSDFSENIGTELFGVDDVSYERSAFLPQKVLSSSFDTTAITAKLNHMLDTGDDLCAFEDAMERLEKKRRYYFVQGNRGKIADYETQVGSLTDRRADCLRAAAELSRKEAEAKILRDGIAERQAELAALRKRQSAEEQRRTRAEALSHARSLRDDREQIACALAGRNAFLGTYAADTKALDGVLTEAAHTADALRSYAEKLTETETKREENVRLLREYESRFPDGVPTEETIRTAERLQTEIHAAQIQLSIDADGEAENNGKRMETLSAYLCGQSPSSVDTERISAARQVAADALAAYLAEVGTVPQETASLPAYAEYFDIRNRFEDDITLRGEITRLEEDVLQTEKEKKQEKRKRKRLLTVSGVCLSVGILLFALAFSGVPVPPLCGFGAMLAGIVFLVLSGIRKKYPSTDAKERLLYEKRRQLDADRIAIESFVRRYADVFSDGVSGKGAAEILDAMEAAYTEREAVRKKTERCREEKMRKRTETETALESLLAPYSLPGDTAITRADILLSAVGELTALLDREQKNAKRKSEHEATLNALLASRDALFASVYVPETGEERLAAVRTAVRCLAEAKKAQTDYDSRCYAIKAELETLTEKRNVFLSRFFKEPYPAFPEAIRTVMKMRDERETLQKEYAEKEKAYRNLCLQKGITDAELNEEPPAPDTELPPADIAAFEETLDEYRRRETLLRSDMATLSEEAGKLAETEEALAAATEKRDAAKHRISVIQETEQYLETAKNALSTQYLSVMERKFREYYGYLTDEDAEPLSLDSGFAVQNEVGGVRRAGEAFSRGYRDLMDFCIRLALVDAMYETDAGGETPFLILDDPFVNLDDGKLLRAKRLLAALAKRYQILYFVCTETRTAIFE